MSIIVGRGNDRPRLPVKTLQARDDPGSGTDNGDLYGVRIGSEEKERGCADLMGK